MQKGAAAAVEQSVLGFIRLAVLAQIQLQVLLPVGAVLVQLEPAELELVGALKSSRRWSPEG